MAIVSSKLDRDNITCNEDKRGMRTYQVRYRIETDGQTTSPGAVLTLARAATPDPVPGRFATWSYQGDTDGFSFAEQFRVQRRDRNLVNKWFIDVSYLPLDSSQSSGDKVEDPLARPVKYQVDWIEETRAVRFGENQDDMTWIGRPPGTTGAVINAAGETPDEEPQAVYRRPILHCIKNYATLQEIIDLNSTYQNTVNDATFFGAPIRTVAFIVAESGLLITEGANSYYSADIQFDFNYQEHTVKFPNTAWKEQDPGNPAKLIVAREEAGNTFTPLVSNPVNIGLDAKRLPATGAGSQQIELVYRYLPLANYLNIGVGGGP